MCDFLGDANMKIRRFLLIVSLIILTSASSLMEASAIKHSSFPQKKDEEEKKMRIIPTPKILESQARRSRLKISLHFIYDFTAVYQKAQPLHYPQLKIMVRGLKVFFAGPVNRPTGNPLLDAVLVPVYSLNRDPVTRKFWWD